MDAWNMIMNIKPILSFGRYRTI